MEFSETRPDLLTLERARAKPFFSRLSFPLAFAIVDCAALIMAATVAHWLPNSADEQGWQGFLPGTHYLYPTVFTLVSLAVLYVFGFYDRLRTAFRNSEIGNLYSALTISIVVTMAMAVAMGREPLTPPVYLATWLLAPLMLVGGRTILRRLRCQLDPLFAPGLPVLILGSGEGAERLKKRIGSARELDLYPVWMAHNSLSALDEMRSLVQERNIRHVVVAPSMEEQGFLAEVAAYCHEGGLRLAWLQPTSDLPMAVSSLHTWEGRPVIQLAEPITQKVYEGAKRLLDLALTLTVLALVLPLMLVLAVAIKLDSPGPALMRQRRVGRGGRVFDMYKFRSMKAVSEEIPEHLKAQNEATGPMFKMRTDPRITGVGRFIRRLSLDELPQLLNVVRGEMSLVGPRPPLPREIPGYSEMQRKRLMVTPGITGLWQVSGRSNLTFEEMLSLDVRYIQRRSILLDIIILIRTLPCVFGGKGAY